MRYRTFGITATPHGQTSVRVHSRYSDVTRVLSRDQARLLLACDTFRTLPAHAARNAVREDRLEERATADDHRASTVPTIAHPEDLLEDFVDDGFLISEAELIGEVRARCEGPAAGETAPATVTSLGIPTCDRPELLSRALSSYVENAAQAERTLEIVVMDDSRDADVRAQNREVSRAVMDRADVRLRYATREDRRMYAEELADHTDVSHDLVRFALLGDERFGRSYGATRNALLLDAAGTVAVQADDDTVCRITEPPDVRTGLAMSSRTDPSELWFFEDPEEVLEATSSLPVDFSSVHERLLGKAPTAWMADLDLEDENLDVDDLEFPFLERMGAADARVAVSFLGTAGDSGAAYPYRFLHGGETIDRLIRTEQAYQTGMTARQMIRAVRRATISDGRFCMTTHIGLDHRELLPPFAPVMRNEDGVFGSVLQTCLPGSFTAHLPRMVDHRPPGNRSLGADALQRRRRTCQTNGLLTWIITSFRDDPPNGDAGGNLRALGEYLQEIGDRSEGGFSDFLESLVSRVTRVNIAHAKRELQKRHDAPEYWIEDVQSYIQTAEDALDDSEYAIPTDLVGNPHERLTQFQSIVGRFGSLLTSWPELVRAARHLREQRRRLSEPV